MESVGLFSRMTILNRLALTFLVLAKMCGAVGVCLGFMDSELHRAGGWLLGFSICSIFLSVALCVRQASLDKAKFDNEDAEAIHLKNLRERRRQLETEIAALEDKRTASERFIARRSF